MHGVDLIAEGGGAFKVHVGRGLVHFFGEFADHGGAFGFEESGEAVDVVAVEFFGDGLVAGGGAFADGGEQAWAEVFVFWIALFDVQRAGAELEDGLQCVDGCS